MNNIILIGMPGAGKSTIGVVLAKAKGYKFIDTDILIQEKQGKLLHNIIEESGIEGFNEIENNINKHINVTNTVIATGGSAIYGVEAMNHFKSIGNVVYLKQSYSKIKRRLGDLQKRGVSIRDNQTLIDLYNERTPLYEKYADIIIDCNNKPLRMIVNEIKLKVSNKQAISK